MGKAVQSGRAIAQPEVPVKPKAKIPTKPTPPLRASFARAVERFFPARVLKQVAVECEPKNYKRRIDAPRCVLAFARAYFMLLPGLRAIAERLGDSIGTRNISTISYAIRSRWLERVAESMIRAMGFPAYRDCELAAIDSMCNAITNKRRHSCKKINRDVVGVSVLWVFRVKARAGQAAVEILRFAEGATHDALLMAGVPLAPFGPVYLMDRGFYCLDLIAKWLKEGVRFIVRVKSGELVYTPVETYASEPFYRWVRTGKGRGKSRVIVTFNGTALLGAPGRRGQRPLVRLVVGRLESGESLILASSQMVWPASRLLESYGQRWEIEKWHRIVKRVLGLAHLYSYQSRGLMLMTRVVMLLALLLLSEETPAAGDAAPTVQRLKALIKTARRAVGLHHPWTPNTCGKGWPKKRYPKAA